MNWKFCIADPQKNALDLCDGSMDEGNGYSNGVDRVADFYCYGDSRGDGWGDGADYGGTDGDGWGDGAGYGGGDGRGSSPSTWE